MRRYVTNRLPTGKRTDKQIPKDKLKFKYGHNLAPRYNRTPEGRFNAQIPPVEAEHVTKALKGYWRKNCTICGGKALYRAGSDAYCRIHRSIAVAWWTKHPMRLNFGQLLLNDYCVKVK
jgi:hypothetical protein